MEDSKWKWPVRRGELEEIQERLKQIAGKNIDYLDSQRIPVLGFPGTTPLGIAVTAFSQFSQEHPNNIGCHTRVDQAEYGFEGTQDLEREFIWSLGSLLGSADPEKEIDGYICSGGTEANMMGMWIGRNFLTRISERERSQDKVAVLTSFLAHYSVEKISDQLGFPAGWVYCLPTNDAGELTPAILEARIRSLYNEGCRRFLVVLTAGTTNLGSIDQISEICALLKCLQKEYATQDGIAVYVHVDAAFGGYVIPFLEPEYPFAFQNPMVSSVTVDAHKMGFVPYPAGVFLCRKGQLESVKRPAIYLGGHEDCTASGSRTGASAAACWAAMQFLGREGHLELLLGCMEIKEYLVSRLQQIPETHIYPSRLNVVAARFPEEITRILTVGGLAELYCLPSFEVPRDFSSLPTAEEKPTLVFRFIAMPHLGETGIHAFLEELNQRLGK